MESGWMELRTQGRCGAGISACLRRQIAEGKANRMPKDQRDNQAFRLAKFVERRRKGRMTMIAKRPF